MAHHLEISPSFSPSAQKGITAAFASWKAATGVTGDVAIGDCTSTDPTTICVHEDLSRDHLPGSTRVLEGYDKQGSVTIYSNSIIAYVRANKLDSRTEFQRIAGHELGHAFGLGHSARGNVMAPYIEDMALAPTDGDVDAFWSVEGR